MNRKKITLLGAAVCSLFTVANSVVAQGTAFTYQGQLQLNGMPVNGLYDFTFMLFDNNGTNSGQIGSALTNAGVNVTNGLFTVPLDFGSVFAGNPTWLEIEVTTNGGQNFTALSPLQELTPAPYAIFAESANSVTGTVLASSNLFVSGDVGIGTNAADAPLVVVGASPINDPLADGVINAVQVGGTVTGAAVYGLSLLPDGTGVIGEADNTADTGSYPVGVWGYTSADDGVAILAEADSPTGAAGLFLGELAVDGTFFVDGDSDLEGNLIVDGHTQVHGTFIGGGIGNSIDPSLSYSAIGSGDNNSILSNCDYSFIGGGSGNIASNNFATVGGGDGNQSTGLWSTVGGGVGNKATGVYSATVAGGYENISGGNASTAGGGANNTASGDYATIPGGGANVASGAYSFAAGNDANATNSGSFVWSDATGTPTFSPTSNSVTMRASGGFELLTTTDTNNLVGAVLAAGSGSWSMLSDRNAKNDLAPIDPAAVLAGVAALPISQWSYKTQNGVRHVGPMAQDFHAAFHVGENDTTISSVDENGVALAAIQGLNSKLEARDAEIQALKAKASKVDSLEAQVNELKQIVQALAARK
ncbi:MAG TPA: tail fiber domain-containing protein [Verrucomicrobiae bacterium]